VPEEDLGLGVDSIIDPGGAGPRIWFQVIPEGTVKGASNRKQRLTLGNVPLTA
jgi:hypothetical protein